MFPRRGRGSVTWGMRPFSNLRTLLRSAAARIVDALWAALGTISNQFTTAECKIHIRHCGYVESGR
jgi:hypothetical protein